MFLANGNEGKATLEQREVITLKHFDIGFDEDPLFRQNNKHDDN
jgi:hypothetical protein